MNRPWCGVSLLLLAAAPLLLLLLFAEAAICPPGCSCPPRLANCSHATMQNFPFVGTNWEILDLSSNLIRSYPGKVTDYGGLEELLLSNNLLESLPPLHVGLSSLGTLDLSNNRLGGELASRGRLEHLHFLHTLNVSSNPIRSLGRLVSPSLDTLDASHCAIASVPPDALRALSNLRRLILRGNPLKVISGVWSETLVELDVSWCQLSSLRVGAMPNLERLDVSDNGHLFRVGGEGLAEAAPHLTELWGARCSIERLETGRLLHLRRLHLPDNRIQTLPPHAFANNTQLTIVDLAGNSISYVDPTEFKSATSVVRLDLSRNKLESYQAHVFSDARGLEVLNVSRNPLSTLEDVDAPALATLDASHCDLASVSPTLLGRLPSLRHLNLSHNSIESFPHGIDSHSLVGLDLAYNRLSEFRPAGRLPSLLLLDLSGNRLTEPFDRDTMARLHSARILLENNPWRCDCSSLEFLNFFHYVTNKPPFQGLVCRSPENATGLSWYDACFKADSDARASARTKPWIPLVVSLVSIVFVICLLVSVKRVLDRTPGSPPPLAEVAEDEPEPRVDVIGRLNQLPSYEEALLLPKLGQAPLPPAPPYSPPRRRVPTHLTSSMFNLSTHQPLPTVKMSSSI